MNEMGIVLLVEDDKAILRTNRRILERAGFTVLCAETLAKARRHLETHTPDVFVLDIMLPDGSGRDFCAEIRDSTAAPVLFLTAMDARREVIEGLVAGGNDYITKPYDVEEFAARIKAQMRLARMNRQLAETDRPLTRGPLALDTAAARAYLSGEDLMLSPREYAILLCLMRHEGRYVTAGQLYETAWRLPFAGDDSTVKTTVSRLRKKLEAGGCAIVSARGEGYCLQ